MSNIDKIRQEIERRMHICDGVFERNSDTYYQGKAVAYGELLAFIDSLPEEKPCEDLEEAAREIVIKMHPSLKDCTILGDRLTCGQLMALVKAGAEWQEKQDLKWAGEIHKNGYNLCKEQMLKDAVKGVLIDILGLHIQAPLNAVIQREGLKEGDKVKIVIVKED